MRPILMTLVFMVLFAGQVLAVSPINAEVIKEAQEYGKIKATVPAQEFLAPWTSYEEKATKLDDTAERAYVYTPYLLIASDAKAKFLANQPVHVNDGEKIVADYAGYLVFSVFLLGDESLFMQNTSAVIRQNNKLMPAVNAILPPEASKLDGTAKPLFGGQGYFYFNDKDIDAGRSFILLVITPDKREHSFYFNLLRVK